MKNSTTVQCPNCKTSINVNDILKHQIEDALRKDFEQKIKNQEEHFKKKNDDLLKEKQSFENAKALQEQSFADRLAQAKKESENDIRLKIKQQLEEEQRESLDFLQKELSEQTEKVKELNTLKASLEAENELKINEILAAERERIQKLEKEKSELREKDLLKQIEDQKKLTEEMKRKQEQGSMQLQGEVLELALEDFLKENFRWD